MKIIPFEIGKIVSKAIKNKDRYQARIEEIKANPLMGTSGLAKATFDIDGNRIAKIEVNGLAPEVLEQIKNAVNEAFDKADSVWAEFEQ